MAWIEQIGTHTWRVRYHRPTGGYATISGFTDAKTARQYAHDLETDRRRGTWIDPAASNTIVTAWVERWLPTLDVEIRTEENYRTYLRNHILPRWGHIALGDITALDVATWLNNYAPSTPPRPSPASDACSPYCSTTPSTNASSPPAHYANIDTAVDAATTHHRGPRKSSPCPNTSCVSRSRRLNWAALRPDC